MPEGEANHPIVHCQDKVGCTVPRVSNSGFKRRKRSIASSRGIQMQQEFRNPGDAKREIAVQLQSGAGTADHASPQTA